MTGKEETSPRGRGGIGDQARLIEHLAEVESILAQQVEKFAWSQISF